MFLTGADDEPLVQRVKTLRDGYLPVVEYTARREGIAYHLEDLCRDSDRPARRRGVQFVRATLTNETADLRTAYFATAVRFTGPSNLSNGVGDNRFLRPRVAKRPGDFYESGEDWNPNWTYTLSGNALLRDGKILYLFPGEPRPRLSMSPQEAYNRVPDLTARELRCNRQLRSESPSTSFHSSLVKAALSPSSCPTIRSSPAPPAKRRCERQL